AKIADEVVELREPLRHVDLGGHRLLHRPEEAPAPLRERVALVLRDVFSPVSAERGERVERDQNPRDDQNENAGFSGDLRSLLHWSNLHFHLRLSSDRNATSMQMIATDTK